MKTKPTVKTPSAAADKTAQELPLEHIREYDGAAEWFARTGKMPLNMGSPGAIDWIEADPEAFEQRVMECKYAQAMERLNLDEQ